MASIQVDLEAHLTEVRASLKTITGTPDVIIRATLPANAAYPQSKAHLIIDVVPTTPSNAMDGSLFEDLALQVGAWASDSLVTALALADAARVKMAALGYARSGGTQLTTEDAYHGVILTFSLVGAFDALT